MNYTVVVFSSRSETMQFYNIIKKYGLFCSIINTPRSLASSCGISTKIDYRLISPAKKIINPYSFSTFRGIFKITFINEKEIIEKLY